MDIKKFFRDAEIGKVESFHLLSGEEVIGKILSKESKRGRTGGTTLAVETDKGIRHISFRDCALPEKVEAQVSEAPAIKRETAAERIARVTHETQEAMARSAGRTVEAQAKVEAPIKEEKIMPVCPLFVPINPEGFLSTLPAILAENLLTEIVLVGQPEMSPERACFVEAAQRSLLDECLEATANRS